MDQVKRAHDNLTMALDRLRDQIDYYKYLEEEPEKIAAPRMDSDEFKRSIRDSLIQRFEFCTDLFWKYLKKYLDVKVGISADINGPTPVIRAACRAKLITEIDSELFLDMIKSRNLTSHIYREEMAEQIGADIPKFYQAMQACLKNIDIHK